MRGRILAIWLALNATAFIFAGQTWWQLDVNTGDQATGVTGTGFDADKSISAILLFGLAALLFVAFSRGWLAVVISFAATASTLLLAILTASNLLNENIGGISALVEKHTGFAVGSFLKLNEPAFVTGQIQIWAWLTLTTLIGLASIQTVFAFAAIKSARQAKPRSDRTKTKQSGAELDDSISLWDAQKP